MPRAEFEPATTTVSFSDNKEFLRDFFNQEMGKALIPDRFIDIFQGRSPRSVLAKHYTPQGIRVLREIYEKANLTVLA